MRDVPGFQFVQLSLRADFIQAARTAAARAAGHFHLPGAPIDVQVMLLQPGEAHDHLLTAQACHSEEGMFRVVLVSQDQLHYLCYRASFVQGAIHITDRDWARKGSGREVVRFDVRAVNEHPGGPRVQERLHCSGFSSVSGLEFNVQSEGPLGSFRLVQYVDNELGRKMSFPSGSPHTSPDGHPLRGSF